MSRRGEGKDERTDVSMVSLLDDENVETANVAPTHVAGLLPPTLPTGQVIDGKNTLQSFAVPGVAAGVPPVGGIENPRVLRHPTLPDGQVIDGKNTLQSFHVDEDGGRLAQQPFVDLETTPSPATVVAVAVDTEIAYTEVVPPEPLATSTISSDHNETQNVTIAAPSTPWYKARFTLALLFIISLLMTAVLGLSLGLRNRSPIDSTTAPITTMLSTPAPMAYVMPTPAPMDPNIINRTNVLTSYINNITLSDQTITPNGTSPESQALSWFIYNDTTLNTAAVINQEDPIARNAVGFRIRQRYPLLVLWFQQTETTQWASIPTGWFHEESECAWEGVTCENKYVVYYIDDIIGETGGDENAVTQISFQLPSSYTGTIPDEIGLLSTLEHFEIVNITGDGVGNNRNLFGTLPDSIGQWTALTYFDVSLNNLTGPLPASIGQWTDLTYFDVRSNALSGTLPASIGQWTALTYFDVSYNAGLNGPLPNGIGNWASLTFFELFLDGFTGTLPDSIGQWTALTSFDAYDNDLTGPLPDSIGQWTVLNHFDVRSNALNGPLPDSIGQWTALTYFDVVFNDLTGTIPVSIGNWSLIASADFSSNQFMGILPDAVCAYIDPDKEILRVDCNVNCTCCTIDCSVE